MLARCLQVSRSGCGESCTATAAEARTSAAVHKHRDGCQFALRQRWWSDSNVVSQPKLWAQPAHLACHSQRCDCWWPVQITLTTWGCMCVP
jgi:hypothetical protein